MMSMKNLKNHKSKKSGILKGVNPPNNEYCNGCRQLERGTYNEAEEYTEYATCGLGFKIDYENPNKGFFRPYECIKECMKARLGKW